MTVVVVENNFTDSFREYTKPRMSLESSDIGNVMANVARKVGVAEAVLRLMVGLLTGKFCSSFK